MSTAMSPVGNRKNKRQRGFTYIMMMVAVMIVGLAAGVGITLVSREVQADREMELLFRGMAYRTAIQHYYQTGQGYPRSLEALLRDPRYPGKRYLRVLYKDPMGGEKGEWQLIRGMDGGIIGVVSRSKATPFKQANFPEGYERFADAKTYAEWIFSYTPVNNSPGRKK